MSYGHKVKIVDRVLIGGKTTLEIDGFVLSHVVSYSLSREVDKVTQVTFTINAESASVEFEGRK